MAVTAIQTSKVYRNDEELDHALVMRLKALKINRLLGSQTGMADDYQRLGILYALRGQPMRAIRLLHKAMKLEQDLGRLQPLADCCFNLAVVHGVERNRDDARLHYDEALALDQQSGNTHGMIHGHLALTQEHLQSGHHFEALTHLNKALVLQEEYEHHQIEIADALVRTAKILLKTSHPASALKTLGIANDIYDRRDHLCGIAEVTALMGVGHHLCGNPKQAEEFLREAVTLNRALGRKTRMADSCANLANLCWASGRHDEALRLYRRALALFIEAQCSPEAQKVKQLLNDLLQQQSPAA